MAKVIAPFGMSLDGFISAANDGADDPEDGMRLFNWYFDGDTPIRQYQEAAGRRSDLQLFALSACSATVFQGLVDGTGAVVTGRRTYDLVNGWNGHGPIPKLPLFIVTHNVPDEIPEGESSYTFVTEGVESAIEQAKAAAGGDKYVSLLGASVPQQCLRAGLLDEIQIHLVPTLLGKGTRLFEHIGDGRIELETVGVVECPGVTHMRFRVAG